jgi:hypothetical protein
MAYSRRADGGVLTSIISGSFYQHDEPYMSPLSNKHWRGMWMLHEVKDGQFDEMPVSISFLKRKFGNAGTQDKDILAAVFAARVSAGEEDGGRGGDDAREEHQRTCARLDREQQPEGEVLPLVLRRVRSRRERRAPRHSGEAMRKEYDGRASGWRLAHSDVKIESRNASRSGSAGNGRHVPRRTSSTALIWPC